MFAEYGFSRLQCDGRIFSKNGSIIVESSLFLPEDLCFINGEDSRHDYW